MVSGLGQKPPGTAFAYDSGSHLQELIWLLEHVTREASVHWATRRLAIPLGVPNMFAGQTESAHVHAGGDNRLPCSATESGCRRGSFRHPSQTLPAPFLQAHARRELRRLRWSEAGSCS